MDTEKKRVLEAEVISKMIAIYCRGNKHADRTRTPRMLLHHPLMTIHHMWLDHQARKREKKEMRS